MNIIKTPIQDAYILEPEKHEDNRGHFTRIFDKNHLPEYINFITVNTNLSFSKKKGTLRGMHYQEYPFLESKIINCPQGSICDVLLDLRPVSKTFHQCFVIELSDKNNLSLHIPPMIAHGFQTLEDNTSVIYHTSIKYSPCCEKTVSYKSCDIEWKLPVTEISEKDKNAPILNY